MDAITKPRRGLKITYSQGMYYGLRTRSTDTEPKSVIRMRSTDAEYGPGYGHIVAQTEAGPKCTESETVEMTEH